MSLSIEDAAAHYRRGELREAKQIYDRLDGLGDLGDGDALFQWGIAHLFSGDCVGSRKTLERAAAAHQRAGRPDGAATAALWIFREYMDLRDEAVAMTWFKRSEKWLENVPLTGAHAHLRVMQSIIAAIQGDLEASLEKAEEGVRIAREVDAPDELALALNRAGRVLIRLGRVQEGQALLDESMVSVTAEQIDPAVRRLVLHRQVLLRAGRLGG